MESNRHCDRFNRPIYRRYTMHSKGKSEVKAWIQRRCKVCGRFIGGVKQFLCNQCYKRLHNSRFRIRKFVFYYGIESIRAAVNHISIPVYLRNSLRAYM